MSYVYSLAGENLELAEAELEGFLKSQEIEENPERKDRLCFTGSEPGQLKRLALVHEVSELLERTEELETGYRPRRSFKVEAHDLTSGKDTRELVERLGSDMETEENSVDLEDPEEVVNLYIFEDEYIISRRVEKIDRGLFEQRKNQHRPFSSPVSLDPVLARVLVNLSEVPAGGKVLDPFCGTGGILIEAGLCGILPLGADLQEEMVEGTEKNLEKYGIINHDIRQGSVAEIGEKFDTKFDSIVTDLPYGKASKTEGDPVKKFLELAPDLTDGKTVFMYNQPKIDGYMAEFEIYVHRNLTRYIFII